jgi:hypothetical protein
MMVQSEVVLALINARCELPSFPAAVGGGAVCVVLVVGAVVVWSDTAAVGVVEVESA